MRGRTATADFYDIDVPEEVILKRRGGRLRHPGKLNRELYYREIVVPEDRKYGLPTKKYADIVIDGEKVIDEIVAEILTTFNRFKEIKFQRSFVISPAPA